MLYLIHFDVPYKHARHYLGYTTNLEERLAVHRAGGTASARLMQVITAAGITWRLARTWPKGTRTLERQLKNRRYTPQLCPICKAEREALTRATRASSIPPITEATPCTPVPSPH